MDFKCFRLVLWSTWRLNLRVFEMWRRYHNKEHRKSASNIFFQASCFDQIFFPYIWMERLLTSHKNFVKGTATSYKTLHPSSINKQTIIKGCLWNQNAWWKIAIMDTKINDSPRGLWCKKIVHCVLLPPVTSYCRIYWPPSDHEQKYRHCNPQTLPYHISTQIFKQLKE